MLVFNFNRNGNLTKIHLININSEIKKKKLSNILSEANICIKTHSSTLFVCAFERSGLDVATM
jgi:hypothetical protein